MRLVFSSETKHHCSSVYHLVIELVERGHDHRFTQCGVVDGDRCDDVDDVRDSILADSLRFSFL